MRGQPLNTCSQNMHALIDAMYNTVRVESIVPNKQSHNIDSYSNIGLGYITASQQQTAKFNTTSA